MHIDIPALVSGIVYMCDASLGVAIAMTALKAVGAHPRTPTLLQYT